MKIELNAATRLKAAVSEYQHQDFCNQLGPKGEEDFSKLSKSQKDKAFKLWDSGDYRAKDALWEVMHGAKK